MYNYVCINNKSSKTNLWDIVTKWFSHKPFLFRTGHWQLEKDGVSSRLAGCGSAKEKKTSDKKIIDSYKRSDYEY